MIVEVFVGRLREKVVLMEEAAESSSFADLAKLGTGSKDPVELQDFKSSPNRPTNFKNLPTNDAEAIKQPLSQIVDLVSRVKIDLSAPHSVTRSEVNPPVNPVEQDILQPVSNSAVQPLPRPNKPKLSPNYRWTTKTSA